MSVDAVKNVDFLQAKKKTYILRAQWPIPTIKVLDSLDKKLPWIPSSGIKLYQTFILLVVLSYHWSLIATATFIKYFCSRHHSEPWEISKLRSTAWKNKLTTALFKGWSERKSNGFFLVCQTSWIICYISPWIGKYEDDGKLKWGSPNHVSWKTKRSIFTLQIKWIHVSQKLKSLIYCSQFAHFCAFNVSFTCFITSKKERVSSGVCEAYSGLTLFKRTNHFHVFPLSSLLSSWRNQKPFCLMVEHVRGRVLPVFNFVLSFQTVRFVC